MDLRRALVSEFLGTAFLLSAVVGSGALAHKLDMGNIALSVLVVSFATMGTLSSLIFALGSVSAHFNPIVTLSLVIRKAFPAKYMLPFWITQIAGGIAGVIVTNLMFDQQPICISETTRSGIGQWIAEFVATFGLLGIIFGCARTQPTNGAIAIPLYVAGAIFFTSSTCFANPAVTIARAFTNTLCGIAPDCIIPFIIAQTLGCAAALAIFGWLFHGDELSTELHEIAVKHDTVPLGAEELNV